MSFFFFCRMNCQVISTNHCFLLKEEYNRCQCKAALWPDFAYWCSLICVNCQGVRASGPSAHRSIRYHVCQCGRRRICNWSRKADLLEKSSSHNLLQLSMQSWLAYTASLNTISNCCGQWWHVVIGNGTVLKVSAWPALALRRAPKSNTKSI